MDDYTPEDLHRDILIAAIEGGTGYWAQVAARDYENITATLVDMEDGTAHSVDRLTVANGLRLVADGNIANRELTLLAHWARVNPTQGACEIDAELADCIVQAGIFGQLVYG